VGGEHARARGLAEGAAVGLGEVAHRAQGVVGRVGDEDLAPGASTSSSPGHQSLTMGVAHAAASNRRTLGLHPAAIMSARVTLSVKRCAE
jgi:hypothetical protein